MNISIEGPIAVGKTTLINNLLEKCDNQLVFVKEDVEKWQKSGAIEKFYKRTDYPIGSFDRSESAFAFQCVTCLSRYVNYEKYNKCSIITERCLLSNRYVFGKTLENEILPLHLEAYESLWNGLTKNGKKYIPDKIIYLDVDDNELMNRYLNRGRIGEMINIDYQKVLRENYFKMFEIFDDIPILKINDNNNQDILNSILDFCGIWVDN